LTRYGFEVSRRDQAIVLGRGTLSTSSIDPPDREEDFTIALMSCHQPFDGRGRLLERSVQMLHASLKALRQHRPRLILMVGDQVYSDYQEPLSLFNPTRFEKIAPPGRQDILDYTADEIRTLFHQRYRYFCPSSFRADEL
jgi:hypothetical protein